MLAGSMTVLVLAAACGGGDDAGPAPGLFESQGVIDWDPIATRAELAERSDRVVIGTLSDVADGYVFGSSIDDEFGSPVLELLLDVGDTDPFRVLWWYVPGHDLDDVRAAFPIGSRLAVFATRFEVPTSDAASMHHVGRDDHDHWQWTNPQGLLLEDPESGDVTWYNPEVTFADAPPPLSPLEAWVEM